MEEKEREMLCFVGAQREICVLLRNVKPTETMEMARYIEYYKVAYYCVFWKSKQIISLLEEWARWKTVSKCKQISFIPQMV